MIALSEKRWIEQIYNDIINKYAGAFSKLADCLAEEERKEKREKRKEKREKRKESYKGMFGLEAGVIRKLQDIFSKYDSISKVVLYGSRAMGNLAGGLSNQDEYGAVLKGSISKNY